MENIITPEEDKFPDDPLTISIPTLDNGQPYIIPYENSKDIKYYLHPDILNVINSVYPSDQLHLEIFKKYATQIANIPVSGISTSFNYPGQVITEDINDFLKEPKYDSDIRMIHYYLRYIKDYLTDIKRGNHPVFKVFNKISTFNPDTRRHNTISEIKYQSPLPDEDTQVLNNIYKEYTSRGYIWSYFGFLKVDHPLVVAHFQGLNPTTGTFELANTLIPNTIYSIKDLLLFKSSNEITWEIKEEIFKLGIEAPNYPRLINPLIDHFSNDIDITYEINKISSRHEQYNTYVRNRRELIAAAFGSKLLGPIIATGIILNYPEAIASGSNNLRKISKIIVGALTPLGWTKKSLIKTIRNSGLVFHHNQISNYIKENYRRSTFSSKKEEEKEEEEEEEEKDNRIVYYGRMPHYWLKNVKQGKVSYTPLPGFTNIDGKDHNKLYYMTIYRKIFATLRFIDWTLACQQRVLGLETLKSIAQTDYFLSRSQVDQMTYDQLCSTVSQLSIQKKNQAREQATEATEIYEPLIYQPGGVHNIPSETTRSLMGANIPKFEPVEATIVPEIVSLCANPNSADRSRLLSIANELGLPIKPGASNEEICRSMNAYLRVLREARRL